MNDTPSRARARCSLAVLLLAAQVILAAPPAMATRATEPGDALAEALDTARGGRWRDLPPDEWVLTRELFEQLLTTKAPAQLAVERIAIQLEVLHLQARTLATPAGALVLVNEAPDARQGRGVFAFRPGATSSVVLQIPHARTDLETGALAARWMTTTPFRAAAWNTVRRDQIDRPGGTSDLARAERSTFTAFADAALATLPDPIVIQIHGFAADKRRTRTGRDAAAIVSSGVVRPEPATLERAGCLRSHLDPVRIYGLDIEELGGTINPVGRLMRASGAPGFVHLELSAPSRRRLRDDPELGAEVAACLLGQ